MAKCRALTESAVKGLTLLLYSGYSKYVISYCQPATLCVCSIQVRRASLAAKDSLEPVEDRVQLDSLVLLAFLASLERLEWLEQQGLLEPVGVLGPLEQWAYLE